MSKPKPVRAVETVPERASRPRQRQKLIDACISALYAYGPSRTTVDKVVSIAEMSPGIVSFYFDSKAAMLVAALQFLADEFEQQVLVPVQALAEEPVRALERLVALMLDPEIASPRKVSVWYAFWGEANSRQEYYDICGKKDDAFAATVQELIGRVIAEARNPDLDAEAVALGLIGVLEIQWQNFAFQEEAQIDRAAAERRAMAYLRSIFPRQFTGRPAPERRPPVSLVPALGTPRDPFLTAWHFVGLDSELPAPGSYRAIAAAGERALVLRDDAGDLVGFANTCRYRPHALVPDGNGAFPGRIICAVDGRRWDYAGRAEQAGEAALHRLELARSGGAILLRCLPGPDVAPSLGPMPADLALAEAPRSLDVAADWQTLLEQLLESRFADRPGPAITDDGTGLQADRRRCRFPNLVIETRPDGLSVWTIEPVAPGRSRLTLHRYASPGPPSGPDLATLAEIAAAAESVQIGLKSRLYDPGSAALDIPAVAAFKRWLGKESMRNDRSASPSPALSL